jgi:hypothetical protein
MVSQLYVDGITDTVPHDVASTLTAGQIACGLRGDAQLLGGLSRPLVPRRRRDGHQP